MPFATKTTLGAFKSKNPIVKGAVVTELAIYIFIAVVVSFIGILEGLSTNNSELLILSAIIFGIVFGFLLRDTVFRKK